MGKQEVVPFQPGDTAQLVGCLSRTCQALGSVPSYVEVEHGVAYLQFWKEEAELEAGEAKVPGQLRHLGLAWAIPDHVSQTDITKDPNKIK